MKKIEGYFQNGRKSRLGIMLIFFCCQGKRNIFLIFFIQFLFIYLCHSAQPARRDICQNPIMISFENYRTVCISRSSKHHETFY